MLNFFIYKKLSAYYKINNSDKLIFIFNNLIILLYTFYYYNHFIKVLLFYLIIIIFNIIIINDLKAFIIPNKCIISLLIINVIYIIMDNKTFDFLYPLLLNIIFISIIIILSKLKNKTLMGFGDLKLYFVLGLSLTLYQMLYLYLISSIIGLMFVIILKVLHKPFQLIPFGPSICLAYLVIIFLF